MGSYQINTVMNDNPAWGRKQISVYDKNVIGLYASLKRGSTVYLYVGATYGDPDTGGYTGHFPNGDGYAILCANNSTNTGLWRIKGGVFTQLVASTIDCTHPAARADFNADRNAQLGWTLTVNGSVAGYYQESAADLVNDYNWAQFFADNGSSSTNSLTSLIFQYGALSSVTANYIYEIDKTTATIDLNDTSTTDTLTITDWNWLINSVKVSDDQNYVKTGVTQLTDYNICLQVGGVGDDAIWHSSQKCLTINSGDWEAPVTAFTATQYFGEVKTRLRFTCTDNNSGCKVTAYRINAGAWNYTANTGTADVNYSGSGTYNIDYYSGDNSDNNETMKSGTFTIYGYAKFTFKDENTSATITDVQINFNGTNYDTDGNNYQDFNLQGITTGAYTFTFTKAGYSTRYYQTDLNEYSDLNKMFVLLPNTQDADVPFKMYAPDTTTLLSLIYVEVKDKDTNYTVGRLKTNATAETTFNLINNDQNYYFDINNGTYLYAPIALTILYPKNEETLTQIDENWKVDITQNLFASYTELNTTKTIYILPNTSNPYTMKIVDMNGNYFTRTYSVTYPGNPLTATLQPYLVDVTTGLLTTINTVNSRTNLALPNVTIKIYKEIPGLGTTLVEQILTDSKGQALSLFVLNNNYIFDIYYAGTFLKEYQITATSSSIYISIDLNQTIVIGTPSGYNVKFTPLGTGLIKLNVGSQIFSVFVVNPKNYSTFYNYQIIQNGTILSDTNGTYTDSNKTFSRTVNWVDINQGTVTSRLTIVVGGNTYILYQNYVVNDAFDTNYSIFTGMSSGLRSDLGCSATGICASLLVLALILTIGVAIFASIKMGAFGTQTTAIIAGILMVFFTYITWIPFELTALSILVGLAFIVNERRG